MSPNKRIKGLIDLVPRYFTFNFNKTIDAITLIRLLIKCDKSISYIASLSVVFHSVRNIIQCNLTVKNAKLYLK